MGSNVLLYSRRIKNIERKRYENGIYLLGTAIHTNLGDHLITLAEIEFLMDIYPEKTVIEVPTEMYQVYRERLMNALSDKDLIFINGGGWMGNLWPKEELLIQDMVTSFKNNRLVIFPQTIYFDISKAPYAELIISEKKSFESCTRLLLTVREQQSFIFTKENYSNINTLLIPDITLYIYEKLSYLRNIPKNNSVKYCLREDRENCRKTNIEGLLFPLLQQRGMKTGKITTMSKHRVSESKRKEQLMKRLTEFAKCKMIVTDRLHGMIFSYLVGTPCIVLDNKTKKVSGVYNSWLSKTDLIFPLFEPKEVCEIEEFIDKLEMINNKKQEYFDFSILKEEIING